MKPKTMKIVKLTSLITALTIIVGLIATIVSLALVKVNLTPNVVFDDIEAMRIYYGNTTGTLITSNEKQENVKTTFEGSFKTSLLNALTNGYKNEPYTITKSSNSISTLKTSTKKLIEIQYKTGFNKYLKNSNGSLYMANDNAVQIYRVYIAIEEDTYQNYADVNIYFTTSATATSTAYKLTAHGNLTNLNALINGILPVA